MRFTDLVQSKIEARRAGQAPQAAAAAAREARLRIQAAPLIAAVEAMMARLSEDPMFAAATGLSDLVLQPRDESSLTAGSLKLTGPTGNFTFVLSKQNDLWMHIDPDWPVLEALNCQGLRYAPAVPVEGDLIHLDAFMALAEDHIADFIADIALSPAAHLLEPTKPAEADFGNLTRF